MLLEPILSALSHPPDHCLGPGNTLITNCLTRQNKQPFCFLIPWTFDKLITHRLFYFPLKCDPGLAWQDSHWLCLTSPQDRVRGEHWPTLPASHWSIQANPALWLVEMGFAKTPGELQAVTYYQFYTESSHIPLTIWIIIIIQANPINVHLKPIITLIQCEVIMSICIIVQIKPTPTDTWSSIHSWCCLIVLAAGWSDHQMSVRSLFQWQCECELRCECDQSIWTQFSSQRRLTPPQLPTGIV